MHRLKVALVGPGRMGQVYARLLEVSDLAELVAIVGRSPANTHELAAKYRVPGYLQISLSQLMDHHPDVEAVVVATPEWEHLIPTVQALELGLHVLLEKPVATNTDEAHQIAVAAERAGVVVMPCHVLRFDPRFRALQEVVAHGTVGTVRYMYARRNADLPAARRILGNYHPAYWLMPHDVDVIRWVTGSEIAAVRATALLTEANEMQALLVDLRLECGALARIENCWTSPTVHESARSTLFDLWGSQGEIELDAGRPGIRIYRQDETEAAECEGPEPFAAMMEHFLTAALGRKAQAISMTDALATIVAGSLIERSLATGREVMAHLV